MAAAGVGCFAAVVVALLAAPAAAVSLDSLSKNLVVTASPKANEVLYAGSDKLTVSWSLNASAAGSSSYDKLQVWLCFAPVSQVDRGWRKANNANLAKDKACSQFKIYDKVFEAGSFDYAIADDVPTAYYFIRAYGLDKAGALAGYGQTMPVYFEIIGITGIHPSLQIAAGVFSAFSVAALIFFFFVENRKAKK